MQTQRTQNSSAHNQASNKIQQKSIPKNQPATNGPTLRQANTKTTSKRTGSNPSNQNLKSATINLTNQLVSTSGNVGSTQQITSANNHQNIQSVSDQAKATQTKPLTTAISQGSSFPLKKQNTQSTSRQQESSQGLVQLQLTLQQNSATLPQSLQGTSFVNGSQIPLNITPSAAFNQQENLQKQLKGHSASPFTKDTKQSNLQINVNSEKMNGVAGINIIGITATPVNGQSASSAQKLSSIKGVRRVLKSPQNPHTNYTQTLNLTNSISKVQTLANPQSNSIQNSKKSISGGSSNQSQHITLQKSSYLEKQRMSSHLASESGINIIKFSNEEGKQSESQNNIGDQIANFSNVLNSQDCASLREIKREHITPEVRKADVPQTAKNNHKSNHQFFVEEEIKEIEAYYEAAQDLEVKMVNERAAASFIQNQVSPQAQNIQNQDLVNSNSRSALINQGSPTQDQPYTSGGKVFKRMSLHSKRGRNQPSQNSHHTQTTPTQNVNVNNVQSLAQTQQIYIQNSNLQPTLASAQQIAQKSPLTAQLLKMGQDQTIQQQEQAFQEIMIVNLSKRDDSFYGNDQDIYEYERLGNVMLLNQVKLKEESSLSLMNESNLGPAMFNNQNLRLLAELDEPSNILKSVRSSIKNDQFNLDYMSNASLNEMRMFSKFQTQPAHKQNRFAAIEQELDDSVSRINQSDFKNNPFLLQQRSLSLSSYNPNMSHQQSIYNRKTTYIKRPDSSSPLQDFKSISSGKIMRRDSSTGHLFESPSERTILDVLGLCSSTTHKNNNGGFTSIAPFTGVGVPGQGHMMIGQDLSEIFHLEGMNQQQSMNLGHGNGGQAILMQSQYQNYDLPSRMPSLMFMNQSQSSQNHQILFNNHPGCNGSYTGDSFSTNKIVNNFLDEKRKELEALQEQDRESDTTEQMTFSQNSRDASQDSQEADLEQQSNLQLQSQVQIKLQHLQQNSKSQMQQLNEGELKYNNDDGSNLRQLQRQGNSNQLRKLIAKPSSQKQLIEGGITKISGGMSDLEIKQFSKSNVRAQGYVFSPEAADKSEQLFLQQQQQAQSLSKKQQIQTNEAYQEMYGAIGSEQQQQDFDFGGELEFNKDLCLAGLEYGEEEGAESQLDENGQRRTLRRTSRIFEYYNKSKKDSMSKKKKKRRITSTNGNNNLLSAQSCTRGSNIQMMSIRDILLDKDSVNRNEQMQQYGQAVQQSHQVLMTPDEEALQSNCLEELAENQEKMELKQQRTSKSQRCTQTSFLNRKHSENPLSKYHLKQGNASIANQTASELKITSPNRVNEPSSTYNKDPLKIQSLNSQDGQSSPKVMSDAFSQDYAGQRHPQSGNQKSRNYLFSQTILSSGAQLAKSESQQQLPINKQQITLSSLDGSTPNLRKAHPVLMSEQHSEGGKHKNLYTPTAISGQPKSVVANQRSHTQNKCTQDKTQSENLRKQATYQTAREEGFLFGANSSEKALLQINTDDIDSEGPSIKKTNLSQGRKQAPSSNQNLSDSSKRNLTLTSNAISKSTGTHAQQQQYSRTLNDNNYINHKQLVVQEQYSEKSQKLGKMGSSPSLTQLRLPQSQDQNQIKSLAMATITPMARAQGRPSLGGKQKSTSIKNQKEGKSGCNNRPSNLERKDKKIAKEAIRIEHEEEEKEGDYSGQDKQEPVVKDFEKMLSYSNLNQQIANESLPKSHNGSLRVKNLQSCSHQMTQQNIDVGNNQLVKDILIAQFEGELNRTAPDDLSASYMNIGNSTVEMKIQNAANIKTFDFRPSKQPQ